MKEDAVVVSNVKKSFVLPQHKNTSVKQGFINLFHKKKSVQQQALDGVSFEVKKGEFFGIIGRNGGGKSTLLKILAGVYSPTSGAVYLNGGLTPFIELGVGFNPELSGRDNVFLNGALLGFTRKQMEAMYDEIVDFAEIQPFMDQKLKNYSSGMQVRLAFSIAIKAKNDILIFDEVLAVGDENFQKKCLEVFEDLKRSGSTIIFVSHAMGPVRQFCDRVAVISEGKVVFIGDTEKAIDRYHKLNSEKENIRIEAANKDTDFQRLGSGKAEISNYEIYDSDMKKSTSLKTGEDFTVRLTVAAKEKIENCAVGVMFRKNPQENLYGLNTHYQGENIKTLNKGAKLVIEVKDKMPLNPGKYFISFAIAGMKGVAYEDFDNLNNIMSINVTGPDEFWGVVASAPRISLGGRNG